MMTTEQIIRRRIELKNQLIIITQKEIKELEEQLNKKADTLAQGKTGNPEPAAAS
jgi:hypothetical protein